MTSRQVSLALRSVWQSIPLSRLRQGSKLTIQSSPNLNIPLHLKIIPEWRDDGHLSLHQKIPTGNVLNASKEVQMGVKTEPLTNEPGEDRMHVSVEIDGPMDELHSKIEPIRTIQGFGFSNINISDSNDFSGDERPDLYSTIPDNVSVLGGDMTDLNNEIETDSGVLIIAKVPEKLSLSIQLSGSEGNIAIMGKVEGNSHNLHTNSGSISMTKLRGESVSMKTSNGFIHASKFIEADNLCIELSGISRVRSKMVSARDACISVRTSKHNELDGGIRSINEKLDDDDSLAAIDISSLYITGNSGAFILLDESTAKVPVKSSGKVRVKYNHGHVSVNAVTKTINQKKQTTNAYNQTIAIVELGGVNGSCDVTVSCVNSDENNKTATQLGANIHIDSLSPDSISTAHVDEGDINLTFDRKVESDVRLLSSYIPNSFEFERLLDDCVETIRNNLADYDKNISTETLSNSVDSTIKILTKSFDRNEPKTRFKSCEFIDGVLRNKSKEKLSRFDAKLNGAQGKIDLTGAASQALDSFSSSIENARPLLAASTKGNITVESLSWIGAITRRYGMESKSETNQSHRMN